MRVSRTTAVVMASANEIALGGNMRSIVIFGTALLVAAAATSRTNVAPRAIPFDRLETGTNSGITHEVLLRTDEDLHRILRGPVVRGRTLQSRWSYPICGLSP